MLKDKMINDQKVRYLAEADLQLLKHQWSLHIVVSHGPMEITCPKHQSEYRLADYSHDRKSIFFLQMSGRFKTLQVLLVLW